MNFTKIIGNESVKGYLSKALQNNNLANTILFSGPDGIGKSLFAASLSLQLMYPDGFDEIIEKKIDTNNHPDLHLYFPEGKTGMHSISSIRDMIDQVFMQPFEAKAKVFILYDAHRMLPSSANAVLKTLEEPTFDSYIILITSKSEDLLPTIVSRCNKVKFNYIAEDEISNFLQNMGKSPSQSRYLAHLANGSIGRALELANFPNHKEKRNLLIDILSKNDINNYLDLSDAILKLESFYIFNEKDVQGSVGALYQKEIEILFSQILMWYTDLHILKEQGDRKYLYFQENITTLLAQDLSKMPSLEELHLLLEDVKIAVERNIKLKTCLEYFFLKINLV
jgi:DNA polymerase III subunit delta'